MRNCCGSASGLLKVAIIVIFFSVVLHVIGFATPFWSQRLNSNEGLWQVCQLGVCVSSFDSPFLEPEAWFKAVQGLMILSFIFAVVAIILLLVIVSCAKLSGKKSLIISALVFALATALFILVAIIVYGVRGKIFFEAIFAESFFVGFSYTLVAISVFGFIVVSILLATDLHQKFREEEEEEEEKENETALNLKKDLSKAPRKELDDGLDPKLKGDDVLVDMPKLN